MDDKFIKAGLEALRNKRSATMLLNDFVFRHKRGLSQDKRVMDFLHDAFCQILCNVSAEKALHLKDSKPGPKTNSSWERDLRIYEAVIKLHKVTKEPRRLEDVFDKLANDGVWVYGWFVDKPKVIYVSRRIIVKAYYKYRKMIPYNK